MHNKLAAACGFKGGERYSGSLSLLFLTFNCSRRDQPRRVNSNPSSER